MKKINTYKRIETTRENWSCYNCDICIVSVPVYQTRANYLLRCYELPKRLFGLLPIGKERYYYIKIDTSVGFINNNIRVI